MDINYHPCVCHQTASDHIHYNIIMHDEKQASDLERLQEIARKISVQIASQVVETLLTRIAIGFDISIYGVDRVQKEILPTWQICHKGENDSPSVDWDTWLFGSPPITTDSKPPPVLVAHIYHR